MKCILFLTLVLVTTAHARLRWTLEECVDYYGPVVKTEPAWCGGTAYSFIKDGLFVYAIIPDGKDKVADVSCFPMTYKGPITDERAEKVWLFNQTYKWDAGSVNDWVFYNGRKKYKKLGLERFEHVLQYDRTGKYGNVGNRKGLGYQVRDIKQFYAEQREIKKLAKAGK